MAKRIPKVSDLIDQLGGGKVVADELNKLLPASEKKRVRQDAVYKWAEANTIPHYRRPLVARLAKQLLKDQPLPPILAGYDVVGTASN